MQKDSTMFAECDTIEEETCRLMALFSSMTAKDKQDVLSYAESLLNDRKELPDAVESSSLAAG